MRLADFILSNTEPILQEWEAFARGIAPGAKMDNLALRDHADAILLATVHDMKTSQSASQRAAKARGRPLDDGVALNGASELHAVGRLGSGFDLMEVVSEYRALRASVLELWRDSAPEAHERDVEDLTRFNESIDQSLTKAVSSYTKRVDQSRDLFLAILSHDLRNPLNSIAMSAALLPQLTNSNSESTQTASQISSTRSTDTTMSRTARDRRASWSTIWILTGSTGMETIVALAVPEFQLMISTIAASFMTIVMAPSAILRVSGVLSAPTHAPAHVTGTYAVVHFTQAVREGVENVTFGAF
jgi:signal transduction histidine kinase